MNINAGNLQKGQYLIYHNEIWQLTKTNFYSPGKGSALMRTTMKNIKTGKVLAYTFKSQEKVELAEIDSQELQYLYQDAEELHFMNPRTYDQFQLSKDIVGKAAQYFKEGATIIALMYEGEMINIRLPKAVKLKVIEAENAVKGNTVSSPKKIVKLETGVTLQVPLFVKEGDLISVNPETGEYLERAGKE